MILPDGVMLFNPQQPKTMKTKEEITIEKINQMGHYEMCSLWRFASPGHPYFDKTLPYAEVFKNRLFNYFGGFTPEISKSLSF